MDRYIEWLKKESKSEKTIRVYINALKKLIRWYENTEGIKYTIEDVTTLHINEFRAYLDKIEKLSPSTINKILAALKTYFKYASEEGLISYNPIIKVKIKRSMAQQVAPKWLSKQDNAKFFHAIEQNKNEKRKAEDMAICRLMGSAGLRVQEVSDLNICDISLEKRREDVTIRNGKGDKFRIVPFNYDIIESLNTWLKFRGDVGENEPLFISERNSRISTRSIHRLVVKYAKKASLRDVSPHTLRHTFCKNLIDKGIGLERVAYLAGHESLETTRRYTQPSKNDLRNAVQSISERNDYA